jgi:hypothetical protein
MTMNTSNTPLLAVCEFATLRAAAGMIKSEAPPVEEVIL